jgi:hypothetical protein
VQPIALPAPNLAPTESKPPESKPATEMLPPEMRKAAVEAPPVTKAAEVRKKKANTRAAIPAFEVEEKKPAPETGEVAGPPAKIPKPEEAARTTGMWTLADVPDLLAKADAYAGKGDYQKAIVLYKEILTVDAQNHAAKEGLRRAQEAQGIRRSR